MAQSQIGECPFLQGGKDWEGEKVLSGPGLGLPQVSIPQNHSSCKSKPDMLECGVLGWKARGVGSVMVESLLGSQGHHPKAAPIGNFATPGYSVLRAAESQPCQPYALPAFQGRNLHGVTLFTAGFIDFIVEPTFSVLTDVAEKSVQPLVDEDSKSKNQPR